MTDQARRDLVGSRIRERRLARGLRQGALADAVGISPSYLNLIEHNHRRIGGKLLIDLARALDVEPALLIEGAEAGLGDLLQAAARLSGPERPETDRIEELAARFPGWSALIVAQERRAEELEARIEALRDRLSHDTGLAEDMHDVLSSVAAIRSTADILVREADLDPAWRGRFHRNLHEEAERLSARATGLLEQFEQPALGTADPAIRALDAVESLFDFHDHHFAAIEAKGAAAIGGILAHAVGLDTPEAQGLARRWLDAYAADAARLPLEAFGAAALDAAYDPTALAGQGGGDVALVLRRLAQLPPSGDHAPFGLAVADAAGAVLFRHRVPGFTLSRYGARCPRWPLYRAFARPGQAEAALLALPNGAHLRAWAVAQVADAVGFGRAPVLHATMLVQPWTGPVPTGAEVIEVGPDCPTCRSTAHVARS